MRGRRRHGSRGWDTARPYAALGNGDGLPLFANELLTSSEFTGAFALAGDGALLFADDEDFDRPGTGLRALVPPGSDAVPPLGRYRVLVRLTTPFGGSGETIIYLDTRGVLARHEARVALKSAYQLATGTRVAEAAPSSADAGVKRRAYSGACC